MQLKQIYKTKSVQLIILVLGLLLFSNCKQKLPEYIELAYEMLPETVQFSIHVKNLTLKL